MRIKLKQMVIRGGMLQILVAVSLVSPCFLRAHVSFSADTSLLCSTRKLVLDAMHTYIHKSCMHTMICFSAAQLCTSKVCCTHRTPTAIINPSFFFSCLPFVSLLLWCGCTCVCLAVANLLRTGFACATPTTITSHTQSFWPGWQTSWGGCECRVCDEASRRSATRENGIAHEGYT